MSDDDSDPTIDWIEINCDPNMIINVIGSKRALEAWTWAEEHKLNFQLVAEGHIIPLDMYDRVRTMITPPYNRTVNAIAVMANYDLDFQFENKEDAVLFKLSWS